MKDLQLYDDVFVDNYVKYNQTKLKYNNINELEFVWDEKINGWIFVKKQTDLT